ncbi:endolysin [Cronobacter phage vB_CsaP_009]|uniref:Putative endolysin n=1 Tax=Cronobacter phage vB_CsaP_009 TaxID=2699738 RepID=A0A679FG88_9CAUD|nr:endolysin [Cronobacter phage vB_CsaP_009]BBU72671.1 putative endolysin [Cronobacter phage vB_CsaP_009]
MKFLVCWLALTMNTYMEAGNQGFDGMHRVADVVHNRVEDPRFPDDVMGVLLQKNQFSWSTVLKTRDEKGFLEYYKTLERGRLKHYGELENFQTAGRVALMTLKPGYKPKYEYKFFYSGNIKPYWAQGKDIHKYKDHYFIK